MRSHGHSGVHAVSLSISERASGNAGDTVRCPNQTVLDTFPITQPLPPPFVKIGVLSGETQFCSFLFSKIQFFKYVL